MSAAPSVAATLRRRHVREASLLRLLTCGSVDDGKSTLLGRLLFDSNAVLDDQLEALDRDSKKFGTHGEHRDFALLVDGLSAEREQGITIDVAYRYFSTPRRSFIVADTPGHEQYTTKYGHRRLHRRVGDHSRGRAQGHPAADPTSFLHRINGRRAARRAGRQQDGSGGLRPGHLRQYRRSLHTSRRHASAFEIDRSDPALCPRRRQYRRAVGAHAVVSRPASAGLSGNSHASARARIRRSASTSRCNGSTGPNLDFRGYAGTVATGTVHVGDHVKILPSRRRSTIARIVTADGDLPHPPPPARR